MANTSPPPAQHHQHQADAIPTSSQYQANAGLILGQRRVDTRFKAGHTNPNTVFSKG